MGRGLGAFAVFLAWGCANPATVPVLPPRDADEVTRQDAYERYQLRHDAGPFGHSWHRADGEYHFGELSDLSDRYAETQDIAERAQLRGIVIGSVSGAGGGIVGYTLGYNLTADSSAQMSDETQAALYGTGAGLIVLAICMSAFWANPVDEFAGVYNENLRRELGLPPSPLADAPAAFAPRPLGPGQFGWVF